MAADAPAAEADPVKFWLHLDSLNWALEGLLSLAESGPLTAESFHLIDGVLQFDFPRNSLAPAVGGPGPALVVGTENRLIEPPLARLLAATDLAEIAATFNPLALVGPSGSGKSLIAQGLVRIWSERLDPEAVAYFTAPDFGRERQAAEAEDRLTAWRERQRTARLLVVEDIDRLRPRATIQCELRDTIDAIIAAKGVVIVTAAREPFLCPSLDAGVRDRLVAGLTVRLERPGLAARRAILTQAAAARGLALDAEQLDRLAEQECTTAGQLVGRLNELLAQFTTQPCGSLLLEGATSTVAGGDRAQPVGRAEHRIGEGVEPCTRFAPPSSPLAGGRGSRTDSQHTLKQILAVAARYFGVTQAAITSKSRRTSLVEARNVVVHLARKLTDLSYADIGRALGNRDHTTIMHADRRLAERLTTDHAIQQAVEELDRIVRS